MKVIRQSKQKLLQPPALFIRQVSADNIKVPDKSIASHGKRTRIHFSRVDGFQKIRIEPKQLIKAFGLADKDIVEGIGVEKLKHRAVLFTHTNDIERNGRRDSAQESLAERSLI